MRLWAPDLGRDRFCAVPVLRMVSLCAELVLLAVCFCTVLGLLMLLGGCAGALPVPRCGLWLGETLWLGAGLCPWEAWDL